MKVKKLFTEYLTEPSSLEEKWVIVGFFAAVMLFGSLLLPFSLLAGELKDTAAFSLNWLAIMGSMFAWLISYWVTLKFWWKLSFNFGWLMYLSSEKDKKRKAARLALKTQHETKGVA